MKRGDFSPMELWLLMRHRQRGKPAVDTQPEGSSLRLVGDASIRRKAKRQSPRR